MSKRLFRLKCPKESASPLNTQAESGQQTYVLPTAIEVQRKGLVPM